MKRTLTALVLALMLTFSVMSVALASDYKITVTNTNDSVSINGKDYTAYKLFDVTYTGSGTTDAHAYSIDSDGDGAWAWATLTSGLTADSNGVYDNTTYGLKFTPSAADPSVYTITSTMTDAQARLLADALGATSVSKTAAVAKSGTASGETATIDTEAPGYWLVYGKASPKDPTDNPPEEVVAACALTTNDPTETVNPKVSIPKLDKKITGEHVLDAAGKAATAEVGSTVNFEIDSTVPDITGYTAYTFEINDTMSNGLSFTGTDTANTINGLAITVGGTALAADKYTVEHTVGTKSFKITIPFTTLQTLTKNAAIVVTYSAIVNDGALTTDYENNTASLTYSNNPYDTDSKDTTPDKKVYVIDVNIDVDKIDGKDKAKLKDAEFQLFKGDTKPADTAEAWYKWDETNKKVTWVARAQADTFKTVETTGKLDKQFKGLEAETTGTKYGLLETKAPAGYNLLPSPTIITLTGSYDATNNKATVSANGATVTNETIDLTAAQNANQPVATSTVENNKGTELPSTGGIGTTIFYIAGIVMVLGAAAIVIARRKAEQE